MWKARGREKRKARRRVDPNATTIRRSLPEPRFQRYQRNHGSTHTNETHDFNESNDRTVSTFPTVATKCTKGIFVQTVAHRGIVETLESWDDAPSNLYGQAVFAVGVVVAAAGQEGFDQPEGERLPFFQRVAGRAAPEKAHLQPVG